MCDVGRIKHHLKHNLWNPNSTILFVGYQAPGTLGRQIVDGAKSVRIFGEEIAVNARVEYIEGYSGHADQEWLLNFVYSFHNPPKHIFLVHGEEEGQEVLKQKIEEMAKIPVSIPNYAEQYELVGENPKVINEKNGKNCIFFAVVFGNYRRCHLGERDNFCHAQTGSTGNPADKRACSGRKNPGRQ